MALGLHLPLSNLHGSIHMQPASTWFISYAAAFLGILKNIEKPKNA